MSLRQKTWLKASKEFDYYAKLVSTKVRSPQASQLVDRAEIRHE
jgi:hypothetical protein